jgi:hypothetical protein
MPCATCGTPFAVRRKDHRFCSAPCRLAAFQRDREPKRRERDAKVRLLLREALTLLEPEKKPSRTPRLSRAGNRSPPRLAVCSFPLYTGPPSEAPI